MKENICSKCNTKIGLLKEKLPLTKDGKELLFCKKCYEAIPTKEKLKMKPSVNKEGYNGPAIGFVIGGIFGAAGAKAGENSAIITPIKKYNLSLDEINTYSIMKFNRHFLLCKNDLKGAVMMSIGSHLKKGVMNWHIKDIIRILIC